MSVCATRTVQDQFFILKFIVCVCVCVCVLCVCVAMILLKVYHDSILLSRHVSRYITISAYSKIGRVRVVSKKYIILFKSLFSIRDPYNA